MTTTQKEYELLASLTTKDGEEWIEDTTVNAKSLVEAGKMAQRFGRQMASLHNAKLEDAWAVDIETNDLSD
jgi:hypothetical protein